MAELDQVFVGSEQISEIKNVEVEWLDYEFVKNCSDVKKLQLILQTLKSGKEGHFPELSKFTEDKLLSILPEADRKKMNILKSKPSLEEVSSAEVDIDNWAGSIAEVDTYLKKSSSSPTANRISARPVRGSIEQKLEGSKVEKTVVRNNGNESLKELSSTKYDLQIDKRLMKHRFEIDNIRNTNNFSNLPEVQRKLLAEREKFKGNEYFKSKEYERAIDCYTRSIAYDSSSPALYTNRAAAYFKLERYDSAELDCTLALELDPNNLKAYCRRATVYLLTGKYKKAAEDCVQGLKRHPENTDLSSLLNKARKKYAEVEGSELVLNDSILHSEIGEIKDDVVSEKKTVVTQSESLENELLKKILLTENEGDCEFFKTEDEWNESLIRDGIGSMNNLIQEGVIEVIPSDITPPNPTDANNNQISNLSRIDDTRAEMSNDQNLDESSKPMEGFTRIVIQELEDDDDDIDDDEEEEDDDNDNDDNDEEEEEDREEIQEATEKFTRLYIDDDDDDDDDEVEQKKEEEKEEETVQLQSHDPASSIEEQSPVVVELLSITNPEKSIVSEEIDNQHNIEEAIKLKEAGNDYLKLKDYTRAVMAYSESISKHPALTASYNNRAFTYICMKNFNLAISDCNFVLDKEPSNLKALYRRALCWKELNNYDHAISDLKTLFQFDPKNTQAKALIDEIVEKMDKTSQAHPEDSDTSTKETRSNRTSSKDNLFNTTEDENDPIDMKLKSFRKQSLNELDSGNVDQAISICNNAIEMVKSKETKKSDEPSSIEVTAVFRDRMISILNILVLCYYVKGLVLEGVMICEEILSYDPMNFRAVLKRAEGRHRLGDYRDAVNDVLTALDRDSTNLEAINLLQDLTKKIGEKEITRIAMNRKSSYIENKNMKSSQTSVSSTPSSSNALRFQKPESVAINQNMKEANPELETDKVEPSSINIVDVSSKEGNGMTSLSLKKEADEDITSTEPELITSPKLYSTFKPPPPPPPVGKPAYLEKTSASPLEFPQNFTKNQTQVTPASTSGLDSSVRTSSSPTNQVQYPVNLSSSTKVSVNDTPSAHPSSPTKLNSVVQQSKPFNSPLRYSGSPVRSSSPRRLASPYKISPGQNIKQVHVSVMRKQINEWKEKGNAAMAENVTDAINAYSQAISLYEEICGKGSTVADHIVVLSCYYNRAHGYINAKNFSDAEKDAGYVSAECSKLLHSPDLPPERKEDVERVYRNGLSLKVFALKSLGDSKMEEMLEANKELVSIDPSNDRAKKDLKKLIEKLETLKKTSTTKSNKDTKSSPQLITTTGTSTSNIKVNNTDLSSLGMTEVRTTQLKSPRSQNADIPENITTSITSHQKPKSPISISTSYESIPNKNLKSSEDSLKQLMDAGVVKMGVATPKSESKIDSPRKSLISLNAKVKLEVPQEPPKTVYELERIWRGLKSNPDLFGQYLACFKPNTYRKVFKESISPDLISSVFVALRDHCSIETIFNVLEGLQQAQGFNMMIQLLPQDDINCLKAIFVKLRFMNDGELPIHLTEKLKSLRTVYNV